MARVQNKPSREILNVKRTRVMTGNMFNRAAEWRNFNDEMPPAIAIVVTRVEAVSETTTTTRGDLWAHYRANWGMPHGQWRLATPQEAAQFINQEHEAKIDAEGGALQADLQKKIEAGK